MKQYAVLSFEAENNSLVHFVFVCHAEGVDHAEELCINAYPNCNVVWVEQGTEEEAFESYWYWEE